MSHPEPTDPTIDAEMSLLRTTLDLTNSLLGAVSMEDPVHALVSRVGALCRGTCVVYDPDGRIVASAGEAPAQLIWNEIAATNVPNLRFRIGRFEVQTRTVGLHDGVHVLAIASRTASMITDSGDLLLDITERMFGAVNGIQHGASVRNRRENEQLIAALQDGVLPSREHRFWARLSQFKFKGYLPLRAFEVAPLDTESADDADLTWLIERARQFEIPLLATLRRKDQTAPATLNAMIPAVPQAETWLDHIGEMFLVGASAPLTALSQTPGAFRETELALGIARTRSAAIQGTATPELIRLDAVDLTTWLRSQVEPRQLASRMRQLLDPLEESPHLIDTLVTFLALNQNVSAAAEALFVHSNTVRYRLSRVEELCGAPLASPQLLGNLTIALNDEILGRARSLSR